jgi:hypothetical protein
MNYDWDQIVMRCPTCGGTCSMKQWHCDNCHKVWLKDEERHVLGKNCGPHREPTPPVVISTIGFPEDWFPRGVPVGRRIEEGAEMLSDDYEPGRKWWTEGR